MCLVSSLRPKEEGKFFVSFIKIALKRYRYERVQSQGVMTANVDLTTSNTHCAKSIPMLMDSPSPAPISTSAASPVLNSVCNLPSPRDSDKEDGAEMLFARLTDAPKDHPVTDCHHGSRIVYLGESYNLSYVISEVCGLYNVKSTCDQRESILHFPVPDSMDDKTRNLPRDAALEKEDFKSLVRKGAFIRPARSLCDKLIRVFFECTHPSFPIFDKEIFTRLYESDQASILTLQTIFMVAVTNCDEQLIHELGFSSRYIARLTFYKRAKALYDADHERDTLSTIQALILMGFWCGSPIDQKDTWHWLGIAVSLAQSTGLHRS
jgi:hypothetical protein